MFLQMSDSGISLCSIVEGDNCLHYSLILTKIFSQIQKQTNESQINERKAPIFILYAHRDFHKGIKSKEIP